jgi:glycosyltransferase involved in cell wall biosynthesis
MQTPFSVVICTRNRARVLERCIDSVFAQHYPPWLFELIVVDNGSTDGTPSLLDRCLAKPPIRMSRHVEGRPGVSASRNTGARAARYDYVAFLDDDAAAVPQWLAAYDAVIRRYGASVIGGRVDPVLEHGVEVPDWWSEADIRGLFGLDHLQALDGQSVATIQWPLWLGGGNSVYRKSVLERHGGFRTDLGPTDRRRRIAEDVELNLRLERAGVPIYYAHDAEIRHFVTGDRLSRRSIWQRAYWAGRTDAAARASIRGQAKRMPVSRLLRSAISVMRMPARTLSVCRLAYDAGYLMQARTAENARGLR